MALGRLRYRDTGFLSSAQFDSVPVFHIVRVFNRSAIFAIDTLSCALYLGDTDHMAQLIGTALLELVVNAAVATGRVANSENGPLSVLLIAHPESGKTSIVSRDCKSALAFDDITSKGIAALLTRNPEVTHLILLDMVAIMSHKETTNKLTMSTLNSMTEEGMSRTADPSGMQEYKFGKRGIVGCLTIDLANDGRNWWNKTGFATRMLPICYAHSPELQIKIKDAITKGAYATVRPKGNELVLPEKSINVVIPFECAQQIRKLSDLKAVDFGEYGYRRLKQFKSLAQGHALLRNPKKPVVGRPEIEFLWKVIPFVSFDKPCLI